MFDEALKAGGVAVVTGAASGVGFASARMFAERGLSVVLADVEENALKEAATEVASSTIAGATALAVRSDVSDPDAVAALADQATALGPIAVLMNNAGIALPTKAWEEPDHWRRLLEVNLLGVLNGIQAFVPGMIKANRPAAIINTGSKQGITTPPGNPGYNVSKAGVKVMTEMLAHELRETGAPISAHLFVPGFTYTGMISSWLPEKPDGAWTSEQTVTYLFERAAKNDFYVLCPDNEVTAEIDKHRVAWTAQDITENRPALSRWHPDYAEAFKSFERADDTSQ